VLKLEADGGVVPGGWRSPPPVPGASAPGLPVRRSASAEAAALRLAEPD
jgi:hypothetical protein